MEGNIATTDVDPMYLCIAHNCVDKIKVKLPHSIGINEDRVAKRKSRGIFEGS